MIGGSSLRSRKLYSEKLQFGKNAKGSVVEKEVIQEVQQIT